MTVYVALLRGINVGGKGIVPMTELRSLLCSLGYESVTTYIQSGNAVFAGFRPPAEVAAEMEEHIERVFGIRTPVVLRTQAELAATLSSNPFVEAGADISQLYVVFLERRPEPAAVDALEPDRSPPDQLAVVGREVYLHLPNGAGRTKLTLDWLERRLESRGTARNWRTVTKLGELAATL